MQNGMFDMTIARKRKNSKYHCVNGQKELKEYMDRLNDYYEVSYYEVARLDEPKERLSEKISYNR